MAKDTYQQHKNAVEERANKEAAEHKAQLKQTWWRKALHHFGGIFNPLIPAFIGAGLISGVVGVLKNLITTKALPASWTLGVTVISVIAQALFAYFNIYVGIYTAKEFGANPGLGGLIGGIFYLPGVLPPVQIPNLFDGKFLTAGQGGIIGVLISVWLMSYVEKFFHRVIRNSFLKNLDLLLTPFLTIMIMGLFTIFVVMPFAGWLSNSLVGAVNWILAIGGPVAGFILGALFLPMVMLSLHQILTPIHLAMIQKMGYTPLLPILAMAGAGQVGAAFGLWARCHKNKQLVNYIKGAIPVGMLGEAKPLIYGVTLPLGRPFITACLGGGIGGAVVAGIGNCGATAIGASGLAMIPLIANGRWWVYGVGYICGCIGGFITTYFWGTPKSATEAKNPDGSPVK